MHFETKQRLWEKTSEIRTKFLFLTASSLDYWMAKLCLDLPNCFVKWYIFKFKSGIYQFSYVLNFF